MRSERKRRRTFLARFMVLFMIINLLSGVNPSVVKSEEARTWGFDNNGNTSGNNQVRLVESGVESTYQDGKFDVKLEVEGSVETVTNNERLDVVLVVDRSGSMKDENRMENAKTAAKQFVDKLIDGGNGKVRVGLVSYGGKIKDKYGNEVPNYTSNPLQNNKNKLKGIIDGYNAYKGEGAGTFTQAALREANKLFEANNNKKILVLISDGLPTYSYSGGSELDFNQIEKAHKNVTKEGYEIWSIPVNKKGEYDSNEWVKGYRTDSYKTGFIWTTEWTYVPYYVKLIPVIEGAGDKTSTDDKARTIAEAKSIKDKGVRIFSVGIGVDNNGKELLTKVATPGNYNDANSSAGNLGKLLNEIADQLKFAVSNADLELEMNDSVEFKNADDLKKIEVEVKNKKTNSEITSKSNAIKNSAKWDGTSKTLAFSGITLDKDEVLNIKYNAELVETHKDGKFKPLNAKAVLYPKGKVAEPNSVLNFIIPSVKDKKTVNLVINKRWLGAVPTGVESVEFNILSNNDPLNEKAIVKKDSDWKTTVTGLPRYKDGKEITYQLQEIIPQSATYKVSENKHSDADAYGNITFTVTNKNTEKVNYVVTKKWGNTPSELQFDTNVQLYAGENKVNNRLVTLKDNNWTATFTDLPKYNDNGDEIKYSVKEVGDKEEKEGKLTLQGYEYSVKHDTATEANKDTITNTVTNASKKTFTAKVTKKWEGGISTNPVKFTFTNKKYPNNPYPLTIEPNEGNEWNSNIELPKFNDDNSLAEYTVTEVAVPGFTTTGGENKAVTASDPNVEFTNKRITQDITVTKEWGATPKDFIDDVTVVLTGTADGYIKQESKEIAKGKKTTTFIVPTHTLDGKEITYKATEQGEKDGKVTINGKDFAVEHKDPYTIVNTYTGLTTDKIRLTIVKKWVGEGRTSVEFEIFDEKATEKNIVLSDEPWTTDVYLPMWDKDGNLKKYTVIEVEKTKAFNLRYNKDFKNEISGQDGTVTFTNERVMKTLTVEKKWVGDAESITGKSANFKIKGGGKEISFSLLAGEEPSTKDTKLPVYDLEGKPIEYTITEEEIEGFTADATPKTVTLTNDVNMPANKSVTFTNTKMLDPNKPFTVHKTWTGKQAKSVSFGLFADDNIKPEETINLTAQDAQDAAMNKNVWTGKFTKELPEYKLDKEGKPVKINYVVKELDEKGEPIGSEGTVKFKDRTYKVESNAVADNNTYNFKNTDITTGDITYTKEWKGEKSDGASFGLFVKADNEIKRVTKGNEEIPAASADKDGKITFKDVDLANHSTEDYVVRELDKEGNPVADKATIKFENKTPVPGETIVKKYEVTYDDAEKKITNTELIDITVNKTWGDNVPKSEQQSVTVGVFYDGVQKGEVELNSNHSWTGKFENLPYVEGGYQVKETKINGINVDESLKKLYNINVENGTEIKTSGEVKVTNSFNLPKAEEGKIKVLKQWTVNPTKEITVKLYKKTVATPAAPSIWEEVDAKQLNNGSVLEAEFTEPTDAEDYQILETAIGGLALTENEIQSILNSDDLETVQYKIGDYEVSVQELDDDVFFIKNANDNLLTEVTATKQWSAKTIEKNKKPVKVQLFAETNGVLEAIGSPVELNAGNQWSTKFKGLDKYDEENEIKYYVAEVGTEKTNITLDDITKGYKLGNSNVTITGDAKQGFVITNDVNLIDVTAEKVWENIATAVPVKFTLYRRLGIKLTEVSSKTLDGTQGWTATFEDQPRVDETTGEDYFYYVFETEINNMPVGIDPLTGEGYEVDPLLQEITYTTGEINNGRYSVAIHGNAANGEKITVKNTFKPNVVPVIPGGDTPGGIPVIPVGTPDPLPTPTPNPSTPVVDVPNNPSPQGPATPVNDGDEDNGVTEIDEDDVPQGDGKEVKKDNKANKDTVEITDNKAPKGTANLPKTGGEAGNFLPIIGLGLIGLGLVIRRRR